jgi:hypothetical protein
MKITAVVGLALALVAVGMTLVCAETQCRGVNVRLETVEEADLETLAKQWNANLIRFNAGFPCACQPPCEECLLANGVVDLERLDWLVDMCEKYDLALIISVGYFPGHWGHNEPSYDNTLWERPDLQDALISFWREVASRYSKRGDVIYGYDLLGEPLNASVEDWIDLARRITAAIREVDLEHAIIVQSATKGHAEAFAGLVPTGDTNTIYGFHLYRPNSFTQQGWRLPQVAYPSSKYDRQYLEDVLRPVVEFQKRYGTRILVGEFGAMSYAPSDSREAWLRDVLGLFEEYGFDYCYWSYRERAGWSLEHTDLPLQTLQGVQPWYDETNPSLRLFKDYLSLNSSDQTDDRIISLLGTCIFDTVHWPSDVDDIPYEAHFLSWRLRSICEVEYSAMGAIGEGALEWADILVMGDIDSPFTVGELQNILRFIENGGGLLFYCGAGYSAANVNRLLEPLGIHYDSGRLGSDMPADTDATRFWSFGIDKEHPIGRHGHAFLGTSPASLEISPFATSILSTEPHCWKDANWDRAHTPGEPRGSFTMIAAAKCGEGRVLVVADDAFYEECNWELLAAGVKWLLGRDDLL